MFNLSRLRFELELLDNNAPYGFWAPRLRGGYGTSLKDYFCGFPEHKNCRDCLLFKDRSCSFPYLFKPHSFLFPDLLKGEPLKNSDNLPVPFVIDSPFEVDEKLRKGSRVSFEFTAFGKTLEHNLNVLEAFRKLGQTGLDVRNEAGEMFKSRYQLLGVQDLLSAGRSLHVKGNFGKPAIRNASEIIGMLRPREMPAEIVIEFVTPVRILRPDYIPLEKQVSPNQKEIARGLRDFYDLVFVLANRIGAIWQIYGETWIGQAEFFRWRNALLKASKTIAIKDIELTKKSYFRFAKDKNRSIQMDGFIGAIHAVGDFTDLIDILLLGELLHLGESTAYGFGQYKIIY
jgi:CRISPR-associated endoribonuclease Cas6